MSLYLNFCISDVLKNIGRLHRGRGCRLCRHSDISKLFHGADLSGNGVFLQYIIQLGVGCILVRDDRIGSDAAGDETQDIPADEGEIQNEYLEFVASRHHAAELERPLCADGRVVRDNEGNHAVGIGFDDAGDPEQAGPQELEDCHIDHCADRPQVGAFLKHTETHRERDVPLFSGTDIPSVHADKNRLENEDAGSNGHQRDDHGRNHKGDDHLGIEIHENGGIEGTVLVHPVQCIDEFGIARHHAGAENTGKHRNLGNDGHRDRNDIGCQLRHQGCAQITPVAAFHLFLGASFQFGSGPHNCNLLFLMKRLLLPSVFTLTFYHIFFLLK